ncbi:Cyclin/Brf1-like TBP-binding protein [Prunus dulcis]|uniref:Cyclin/Brf1-like TBP-binding protein n=1 Tax=Prunus dulcis TaxID=3755 RepID=A0A4Y1R9I1_PRUDU|nr:Cyclin/Brf1-like TBP-binding protein [Prunus dulcis]
MLWCSHCGIMQWLWKSAYLSRCQY